jgi:hypothetical protein
MQNYGGSKWIDILYMELHNITFLSPSNSDLRSNSTNLFLSIVLVTIGNRLTVTFNSDLKVSSLYNTGHNKCNELLPTKLQSNLDKNPTWPRITVFIVEQCLLARL